MLSELVSDDFLGLAVREFDLHQLTIISRAQVLSERQLIHHLLHLLSFAGFLPRIPLFLRRGLGLFPLKTDARDVSRIQHQGVIKGVQRHIVAAGIN